MRTALTPLPRRAPLLPGESLPSLVTRLERLNHYAPGMIGWLCHQDAGDEQFEDLMRPRQARTYVQLAALTGHTPSTLFAASDHRLASIVIPEGESREYLTLPDGEVKLTINSYTRQKRLRPANGVQFCPLCLAEVAYHRLSWTPIASALCLSHHCLLVNQCPQCSQKLSIVEVVEKRCAACQADLGKAPVVSMADDTCGIVSQQQLQCWLMGAPTSEMRAAPALPSDSPAALYRLVDGLRMSLAHRQKDWPRLPEPLAGLSGLIRENVSYKGVLSPASSYYLYRMAFKAILDWPYEFHRFLDAYYPRVLATSCQSLGRVWGPLYSRWLQKAWQGPEFEFVQQGFDSYLLSGRMSLTCAHRCQHFKHQRLSDQPELWDKERVVRFLDVSDHVLTRFIRLGRLHNLQVSASRSCPLLFNNAEVQALKQQWDAGLMLDDAACWLGLPVQAVMELAELGLLPSKPGASRESYRFDQQLLAAFVRAIFHQLKPFSEAIGNLIRLTHAAKRIKGLGLSRATLLQRVAEAQLVAYQPRRWRDDLAQILFAENMIEAFPETIRAERDWLTQEDIAQRLGVKSYVVYKWVKSNLITPVAKCPGILYFDKHEVERFFSVRPVSISAKKRHGLGQSQ